MIVTPQELREVTPPEWTHRTITMYVTTTECAICYSLQPCIAQADRYICLDSAACLRRQHENKNPTPVTLTQNDVDMLLERCEVQQADMERLRRIEGLARVWAHGYEASCNCRGPNMEMLQIDLAYSAACDALIAAVKGGE